MTINVNPTTSPLKPISVPAEAADGQAPATPRQPHVSVAPAITERLEGAGGQLSADGAGSGRLRRSTVGINAAGRSNTVAVADTAPSRTRETSIQTEHNQLADDEGEMKAIEFRIPQPSETVDRTVTGYFKEQSKYASLDTTLGPDWPSHLYIRHRRWPEGEGADTSLVPLREMSWRPRTAGGVTLPGLSADQFDIIHFNREAGVTTVLPELNASEVKTSLTRNFIPKVKENYTADQGAYWTTPADGSTPARDMRRVFKSVLRTETAIRYLTKTLSPEAAEVIRAVVSGRVGGSPSATTDPTAAAAAVSADVSRLTWKGEPVAGAFVFTPRGPDVQDGPAVLWRPGRPVQEFPDVQELRAWVAGENALPADGLEHADPDAAGTTSVDGNVFELRLQDLRRQMNAGFLAALNGEADGTSLTDRLDNTSDPGPYLDLARVRDGEWTEGTRQRASGENAPRQTMELETLRQTAMESELRLTAETSAIPSFDAFTKANLQRQFAQDHPGLATIDPDKTLVQAQIIRRTTGTGGVIGRDEILNSSTYTLTEYAKRNASEWQAPQVHGQAMSPSVSTTTERVAAAAVDAHGAPILDENAQPIRLNNGGLTQLVRNLDVGKQYTDLLRARLAPVPDSGPASRIKQSWIDATRDRMHAERSETALDPDARAALTTETRGNPGHPRALDYIDAVIKHPDPSSRPRVDKHTIVANRLTLGAATERGGGGQMINGVTVIGAASPQAAPNVVLYTPDAPDGLSFRELSDIEKVNDLLASPAWKNYFAERMATADPAEVERIFDRRRSGAGSTVLTPMQGNFYEEAYKDSSGFLIAHAQHRSTTSSQLANRSALNATLFVLDAALSLSPHPAAKSARRPVGGGLAAAQRPSSSRSTAPAAADTGWHAWSNKDPALQSRLVDGNMGPGGVRYQRDPTNSKEYLNIDGKYYRAEYRGGKHVIFSDKNYSESRQVFSVSGGLFVRSNPDGLRGGARVPHEVDQEMKGMAAFRRTTPEFRSSYYTRMRQSTSNDKAVRKILEDIKKPGGSRNAIYIRKHDDALRYAREAQSTAAPPSADPSTSGSRRPMPGRIAPAKAAAPVRVEVTGDALKKLSSRPVYRYLQREQLARERAERFSEFSTRDLAGTEGKRRGILYFTDITPEQMEQKPALSEVIFGKTAKGQLRMNKVEAVQDIELKNLPAGTRIYYEEPHIYTIDRTSSSNRSESGLQFKSVGGGSWMQRFRQKLNGSNTYTDVTVSSASPMKPRPPTTGTGTGN